MRLGQLARKLNIRPSDVIASMPAGTILTENGLNARLSDEQVKDIVKFFEPENWQKLVNEFLEDDTNILSESLELDLPPASPVAVQPTEDPALPHDERPELIKAPKIELAGLKVVGKIELPERKSKNAIQDITEGSMPANERPEHRVKNEKHKRSTPPRKNPVAVARERYQHETEEQKRMEAELRKEKRTKKYREKVADYKQEKPVRVKPQVDASEQPEAEAPSTAWNRFKKWLFRG